MKLLRKIITIVTLLSAVAETQPLMACCRFFDLSDCWEYEVSLHDIPPSRELFILTTSDTLKDASAVCHTCRKKPQAGKLIFFHCCNTTLCTQHFVTWYTGIIVANKNSLYHAAKNKELRCQRCHSRLNDYSVQHAHDGMQLPSSNPR
jgi:hypothetical protein